MTKIQIIGMKINELRKRTGFTQANIAAYLGVNQSLVSKVERGEQAFSSDALEKLANLFGMSIMDFESESPIENLLSYTYEVSELTTEDMYTISHINRIASNVRFMDQLLADV